MTVFVAHAPADRLVAQDLERLIERRGQFAELDDGHTALHPIQAKDVLVLLISKDFVFAPTRLRLEQRALDAWADGRLILVKLDHGIAPVGLRDLPAIDASFVAQREFKWIEVANAIRERVRAPSRVQASGGGDTPAPAPPQEPSGAWLGALAALALMAPGVAAFWVAGSIWLANRIGPTPGGIEELRAGVTAFGLRYGAPEAVTELVFAAAMAVSVLVLLWIAARGLQRAQRSRQQPPGAPASPEVPTAQGDAVFVSYARANQGLVLPVIEAAQREGRKFWLDQQGIAAGDGWAGEIVRAIKGAAEVLVMCSKAAFESDHVKREIYLADRYRKKLLPVFVEPAEVPEDFEYFFAGVQALNLFETPESERPRELARILGVPA